MDFPITRLILGLLLLLYLVLSIRIILDRKKLNINLGDGGNDAFQRKVRAHGNFAEYTPLLLMCVALVELQFPQTYLLYTIAALALVSRYMHAIALSSRRPIGVLRVAGMATTFSVFLLFIGILGGDILMK